MDINIEVDGINDRAGEKVSEYGDEFAFVNDWFLMGSPLPIILIIVSYLLFVLKIGPDFMKNRKPFLLRNTLVVYNMIQVGISYALLHMGIFHIIPNYGLIPKTCLLETHERRLMVWQRCTVLTQFSTTMLDPIQEGASLLALYWTQYQTPDLYWHCTMSDSGLILIASAIYYYSGAKITELLDTVFFVLRKKNEQISFLHVYHHVIMTIMTWLAVKLQPSYILVFLGTINSFVHIIMYGYYGLSTYPSLHKYLWWKKYITKMQLIQFVSMLIHYTMTYATSDCSPPKWMTISVIFNVLLMIYMFSKFYINTYNIKKNKVRKDAMSNEIKSKVNVDDKNKKVNGNGLKSFKEHKVKSAYVSAYDEKDIRNTTVNRKTNSIINQ